MNDFTKQFRGSSVDPNLVKQAIDSGDVKKLTSSLSREDMAKVQAVLNDKEKMEQLLNSPMAKAFLKQMGKSNI